VRRAALDEIARLLDLDERIVFVGSDLGAGTLADAMARHQHRVLMEGIAEQHIVGMSAGLALEGFIPYLHTIATFLTRRALEQVVVDVALHQLPVRLIASGGGMVYAPLGSTHQAIDDFALMRAIPGMAVLAPADPEEMRAAVRALVTYPGPAYVRLGKGGEPNVGPNGFSIGPIRPLREGSGALIISTGAMVHECLAAVDELAVEGVAPSLVHVPTIAPLDEAGLVERIMRHESVLVVEEHLPNGGLWTSVIESLMRRGVHRAIAQISLPAGYAQTYGSQRDHWVASGLDGPSIAERVRRMMRENLDG
tara:strand:+ start:426 stop:1352 length:927 start_codon:yes stop_codon:yes gene_type:complete